MFKNRHYNKMNVILLLLFSISYWQHKFIYDAVNSALFLNITIFFVFFLGVIFSYRNVAALNNEYIAFNSLKEDLEDCINIDIQYKSDPYWRYYRCAKPAIIFKSPMIIEQPFKIISEELARTGKLAMSTATMQNFLDSIEERIIGLRSSVTYISGLLVMLGLLGTFVGLMITLESVGAIIGNLDLSGSANANAIQGLMDDLGVPLQGMATGFSTSLFGLIGSLTLGILGRVTNESSNELKSQFETWLAAIAKVDTDISSKNTANYGNIFPWDSGRMLSIMYRVAKMSLVSNNRVVTSVERLAENANDMMVAQKIAQGAIVDLAMSINSISEIQTQSLEVLAKISDHIETRQEIKIVSSQLRENNDYIKLAYNIMNNKLDYLNNNSDYLQKQITEQSDKMLKYENVPKQLELAEKYLNSEFENLKASVDEIAILMSEIDLKLQNNNLALNHTQTQVSNLNSSLVEELQSAIINTKAAIAHADSLNKQNKGLTANELQNLLMEKFNFLTEISNTYPMDYFDKNEAQKNTSSRLFFKFFGRRTG
jgi:hypothetical protein